MEREWDILSHGKTANPHSPDRLQEEQKEGKYSSDNMESYFTLFESLLAPKSNPLLAVEELHFAKQDSMTSGEFHPQIAKDASSPTQRQRKGP